MEPGWDDDELPPLGRRNPLVAVVAVLLVIALSLGGIAVVVRSGDDRDRQPSSSSEPSTTRPADAPPTQSELDAVVADLSAFVAEVRGLEFTGPVPVKLLDDAAFTARVEEDAIEDIAAIDETEGVLRALGLLDDGVDLAETLRSFLGDGVVGFYDPESGELVVRGAVLTPYVRLTIVHELTHALDDQHFELDRPALDDADDESGAGFSALVEGNALRVEDAFRATLSDDERAEAEAEEARLSANIDLSSLPRVVPELIAFPYAFGPTLVKALLDEGGETRVDEAYASPPKTTEQVLDPVSWLDDGEPAIEVPPPAAEGEVFDQGVLGLWGIVLLLEDELGQADAVEAARGWGGDWYVAWNQGDDVCVRATFEMDSPEDLRELASGLEDWAVAQDDAEVERAGEQVTLRSCG